LAIRFRDDLHGITARTISRFTQKHAEKYACNTQYQSEASVKSMVPADFLNWCGKQEIGVGNNG